MFVILSPAVHVSVLMVDGQTGELPLKFTKPRLLRQIGAQQQTTQNVSKGVKKKEKEKSVLTATSSMIQVHIKILCMRSSK